MRPLQLAEEEAVRQHADANNEKVLWRIAAAAATVATGAAFVFFALENHLAMTVALVEVLAVAILYIRSSSPLLATHPRAFTLVFLLVQFILALSPIWGMVPEARVGLGALAFPLLLLAFHLRPSEYLMVLVPLWGATVWVWNTELPELWQAPGSSGYLLWPTVISASVYAAAVNLSRYRRQEFVRGWRMEVSRSRERERMRSEIEDARQIQLSMLPRSTPEVGWLDISTVSMPASEVGGDYYDFFPGADSSLALVIGDVAGHGLASGLLLSGLRSCLYLLRGELASPADVLLKLDDMVRHTADRRMLVTLLVSFLDPASRSVTLSSAGHPPALYVSSASREARELALPALPLGTRLGARFRQTTTRLAPGDALIYYTDGLTEMSNSSGDLYGVDRLIQVVTEATATHRGAREVRNAILADLANFKGDTRRLDDVTFVVVKAT